MLVVKLDKRTNNKVVEEIEFLVNPLLHMMPLENNGFQLLHFLNVGRLFLDLDVV